MAMAIGSGFMWIDDCFLFRCFDKAVELNQILGTRYVVLASAPNTARGLEGWKQLCGQLTEATTKLQTHGLTSAPGASRCSRLRRCASRLSSLP